MKQYLYIFTNTTKDMLQVGSCNDILKTIKFYHQMPSLFFDGRKISHLVYLEEYTTYDAALARFKEVAAMGKENQIKLIESANPDWVELKPGVNIEL